jgi:hypothetical protein
VHGELVAVLGLRAVARSDGSDGDTHVCCEDVCM